MNLGAQETEKACFPMVGFVVRFFQHALNNLDYDFIL
jgi:hypothetical protein